MVTVISPAGVGQGRGMFCGKENKGPFREDRSVLSLHYMGDTSKNSLKCTLKIHALRPLFVCYASIKKKKEWIQLYLKCLEPMEIDNPNPKLICCLLGSKSCLRITSNIRGKPLTFANPCYVYSFLLTAQQEVGWLSDRPITSWWNQDLHACLLIENPPSPPFRPEFPRLTPC